MATSRPDAVDAGPHTTDDGLFGPDSVTWRAMAHPATGVGASAAAMIQMLYPPVMYVVDQASSFRQKPELRAQRTADYATTITYGDAASAERAGATLRRIHARCHAVHPDTGEQISADDPHLLVWVHNALTWALLRAWTRFGPGLDPTERHRFVVEQKISARLVGCEPAAVASSEAELEDYMRSMLPKLALSEPCLWFRDMMLAAPTTGSVGERLAKRLITDATLATMADEHRSMYGATTGRVRRSIGSVGTRALLGTVAEKLPFDAAVDALRSHVDEHAFGGRRRIEVPAA